MVSVSSIPPQAVFWYQLQTKHTSVHPTSNAGARSRGAPHWRRAPASTSRRACRCGTARSQFPSPGAGAARSPRRWRRGWRGAPRPPGARRSPPANPPCAAAQSITTVNATSCTCYMVEPGHLGPLLSKRMHHPLMSSVDSGRLSAGGMPDKNRAGEGAFAAVCLCTFLSAARQPVLCHGTGRA